MKKNIEILKEVDAELKRFSKKLTAAIKEQSTDTWSRRHYASCKRSAMDLKHELTKLTQDSKYKYLS